MYSILLEMKGISKSFGKVTALKNVDFDLRKGEVHALMGENGAGKSTLMKILTGIYSKDSGSIIFNNKEVEYNNPRESQDDGIAIVHQELNMMNDLTVAENIFIGRETTNGIFIKDKELNQKAKELINLLGVTIDPKSKVGDISVGKQQMVEIVKAISSNAKVIIFDEPTTALSESEIIELFKIIGHLRDSGIGIIYISHRMDEINRITDRVTVMRDGEYVGTVNTKETSKDELINMMVGRVIYEDPKSESNVKKDAPVVLEVKNLNVGKHVKNVSFKLFKGEILGISGLMGSGRTELARAIFGADKKTGNIIINGEEKQIKNTTDAVKEGIGYLSEDRRRYGLITDFDVSNNVAMCSYDNFMNGPLIDDSKIDRATIKYKEDLSIKFGDIKQPVKTLSGGNQQKVVIAKWLERESDILIFDEPTKGIDVGAKSEIYSLMNELVNKGKSIIMISSEMPEILRMSDRILVMCEGRKTKELSIEEATQEKILKYATLREGEE
ncbi:sugar ABC transporter ATP-binding protein [Miniphocaeibacter halophilus]|uniref:Sugar ABC transporter ATP-binding protein n=1 Tax=Miniphocaeibacter halophilus TaxID=2931922 RepID=A0AC61MRU4_9FIRM|nr:sugar ABC transporter ATP-binding protein [Miniphocaeibacter halophilus]QQK08405.1 sugar ABC transporter ATP-binding protein [Miniphocaeibacter halophilus]